MSGHFQEMSYFLKAWFAYAADLHGTATGTALDNCGICEHLSLTHNLSQPLTTGLPAQLS